jgi:hypothetical protein
VQTTSPDACGNGHRGGMCKCWKCTCRFNKGSMLESWTHETVRQDLTRRPAVRSVSSTADTAAGQAGHAQPPAATTAGGWTATTATPRAAPGQGLREGSPSCGGRGREVKCSCTLRVHMHI